MKKISLWAPLLFILLLSLISLMIDGANPYEWPNPFGWLSNPSERLLTPGCS